MRVLISAILIIVISMTGTVFAIEENPAAVDSDTVVSTNVDETKAEEPTIDPRDTTETKDPDDPTLILNEDLPSGFGELKPIDETFQNTMEKSGDKLLSELPEMDTMFTTPIFKIIVLVVGILFVILLLSILAKKKDTKYVAPRNEIRGAKKKEDVNTNAFANQAVEEPIVIAPIEPIQPIEPIDTIEPLDKAKSELDLEDAVSGIEDDFILNLDNESSEELGLSEDLTEDIDVVLEEKPETEVEEIDIDEIDDIDELSKAIQEKEEQLKQLEEEVKTEKENKVKEVEEVIEEKVEDPFSDFKVEEEPAKKPAKKTKAKKSEKTEAVGSAEDFLKNMEKTMKEDKNK